MGAGSRFVSFALTVCFTTAVPELAAREATRRTHAATLSVPGAMGRRDTGEATVRELDAVFVQLPEPAASSVILIGKEHCTRFVRALCLRHAHAVLSESVRTIPGWL